MSQEKIIVLVIHEITDAGIELFASEKFATTALEYNEGKSRWYRVMVNREMDEFLKLSSEYSKTYVCISTASVNMSIINKIHSNIGESSIEIDTTQAFGVKGIDIVKDYDIETIVARAEHIINTKDRYIQIDSVEVGWGDSDLYNELITGIESSNGRYGKIRQGFRYSFDLKVFSLYLSGKQFPDPYHVSFPNTFESETYSFKDTKKAGTKKFTLQMDFYEGFAKMESVICRNKLIADLEYFDKDDSGVWVPFPMVRLNLMNQHFGAFRVSKYMLAPKIELAFRNEFDILDACRYTPILSSYIHAYMFAYLLIDCERLGVGINAIDFNNYDFWLPVEINDIKYKKRGGEWIQ